MFGNDLVDSLREDNRSGASELSRKAADALRGAALVIEAASLEGFRRSLRELCRRVLEAQPTMAPLVTLAREVTDAMDGASSVDGARRAAARAAEDFRSGSAARAETVADVAADLLPDGGTVATISASGTVRRLLEAEAGPSNIRVVCFESRPMREGRGLAEALTRIGVGVTYAVDAAIDVLTPECDLVIFGADSVGDAGVVNKIGSKALARAAREAGVPVYILADETKLLPRGHSQSVDDERGAGEVWEAAPDGVTVRNRYFEVVPSELVSGIVTEDGVMTVSEVDDLRGGLKPLPWMPARSAGRTGGSPSGGVHGGARED